MSTPVTEPPAEPPAEPLPPGTQVLVAISGKVIDHRPAEDLSPEQYQIESTDGRRRWVPAYNVCRAAE